MAIWNTTEISALNCLNYLCQYNHKIFSHKQNLVLTDGPSVYVVLGSSPPTAIERAHSQAKILYTMSTKKTLNVFKAAE